jgi:hypothetical protein
MEGVPLYTKHRMFQNLMGMNKDGWIIIGITEAALEKFKANDYKRPKGVNRSHIFQRSETSQKMFGRKKTFADVTCRICKTKGPANKFRRSVVGGKSVFFCSKKCQRQAEREASETNTSEAYNRPQGQYSQREQPSRTQTDNGRSILVVVLTSILTW